jgi:hypothetical protein
MRRLVWVAVIVVLVADAIALGVLMAVWLGC